MFYCDDGDGRPVGYRELSYAGRPVGTTASQLAAATIEDTQHAATAL